MHCGLPQQNKKKHRLTSPQVPDMTCYISKVNTNRNGVASCADGLSHGEAEAITPDAVAGAEVTLAGVLRLGS